MLDLAIVGGLADLLGSIDLVLGGIALLWCLELAWEEHKALLVLLQASDIGGQRLVGKVLTAWVDGDTDGRRQLAWDASLLLTRSMSIHFPAVLFSISYLQLSERETTTSTNTAVVLDGWAADDRPQAVHWAWSDLSSLLLASIASALLAAGLYRKFEVRTLSSCSALQARQHS